MRIKLVGMSIHDSQGGFVAHMVLCKIMYVAELILGGFVRQEVSSSVQCVVQTRCEKKFTIGSLQSVSNVVKMRVVNRFYSPGGHF